MTERQLFLFWQFNGDNTSYCNYHCPYCYGRRTRNYRHNWNNKTEEWAKAFERLNRDIYFVFSYGEAMGSHGFYKCVDMIGEHPNWTLNILTNLSYNPERLLNSRLAKEKRLFVITSWHPLGVPDRHKAWKQYKKHLLMLKDAEVPTQVMYLWHKPQIGWFPEYFSWLDKNDFRVNIRRKLKVRHQIIDRLLRGIFPKYFAGKFRLEDYTKTEFRLLHLFNDKKTVKYSLGLHSTYGMSCRAGKDMILVEYDGTVRLCQDWGRTCLGNVFDKNFRLNMQNTSCPTNCCGGQCGMLHLVDREFGELPERLLADTFVSQVGHVKQSSPVAYPNREEILECIKILKEK